MKILKVDSAGFPQRWIGFDKFCYYANKDRILWSMSPAGILRGGINARTGRQSTLEMHSIVAVKGPVRDWKQLRVPLKSSHLFRRDKNICAYCGQQGGHLTRDHVLPTSRGGPNTWENVVTACYPCNARKDNRTPEEARMELLYVPYAPNYAEYLILRNHQILADQMEFLIAKVPPDRRSHYSCGFKEAS